MRTMRDYEFKEILAHFLKVNNLTQKAFAERIGIKQSQVSEWLHGKAKPGYDNLKQMVIAFDIPPEYLLGLEEEF